MVSDVLRFGETRQLGQRERRDNLEDRNTRFAAGEIITMRVRRSSGAGLSEFRIPYRKWMRVLDALNWIAENEAPDLAYRWFCGSKMCGTCAVRMNGREVLACWEAVEPDMTIEPLRNLPVIRDLVVDRGPFERKVAELEPWIERSKPYSGFPEPLHHKDMKNASKALDCIGCMCCYSACPVIGLGDLTDFAGPVPLVQLGQTALDPRNDAGKVARSLELTGIFNCVSCYKCEEVCPASIPIVSQVIEPLKAKAAALVPEMARMRVRCARSWPCAAMSIRPRWCSKCAASGRCSISGARCGCSFAARSIRSRHFCNARRERAPQRPDISGARIAREVRLLSRLLGAIDLRRAQRSDPPGRRQARPRACAARFRDLHGRA
jgi:succinate dehydrogenase/fumarate reductase iron-sulfur protein